MDRTRERWKCTLLIMFGDDVPVWGEKDWSFISTLVGASFMLCLVGMNDCGRHGMRFELCYRQLFIHSIPTSIPFLTLYTRDYTPNFGRNAPFPHILNFFSNLIITILRSLNFFGNFPPTSIMFIYIYKLISILPTQTQQ